MRHTQPTRNARPQRRGSALVLISVMLLVFAMMTAITIDFANIQLIRTEMRAATDAAAKAGAEALARTEDIALARAAAVHYASLNRVGGDPLLIRESDIEVGRLEDVDGQTRRQFVPDESPPNAVRVNARTGGDALHPAVPLFFPGVHGQQTFAPGYLSTAGQQEVEVALVLDRSGSMLFDMSGTDFSYPPNNPYLMPLSQYNALPQAYRTNLWRNHLSPPHPTESRWAVLAGAIDVFLYEAGQFDPAPRTALVTWSSDYTMPVNPNTVFHAATTDLPLPYFESHNWNNNQAAIQNLVHDLGVKPMMGATNLSAGLDAGVIALTGPSSKSFTNKVIILFTDGEWNFGRHPVEAAYEARDAGVIVHCITFLTTDQSDIQDVAEITGGRYYFTQNEAELRDAFQELARSLPVVLTD